MLNGDPWGKSYKVITKAFKGSSGPVQLPDEVVASTVNDLFLAQQIAEYQIPPCRNTRGMTNCPKVTLEEVWVAINKIGHKKAPGLDQMLIGVIKKAFELLPSELTRLCQVCVEERLFPDIWKVQKLILLPHFLMK